MKNLKVPLIIILLAALIYGGAKGLIYYKTQSAVDQMVQQAQLFAEIRYDGISSDLLKGRVAVENISITPVTLQDSINIREAAIQGDGPMFLFSDAAKLNQQTPEKLIVSVAGIDISLDGQIMQSMNAAAANQQASMSSCTLGGTLTAMDLRAIGLQEIAADMFISVSRPKLSNKTRMEVDLSVYNMAEMSISATLSGADNPVAIAMAPQADEVRFVYKVNTDYMQNMKKYCAAQLAMDEAAFIESYAGATDEQYLQALGFIPGKAIRQAISDFMQQPGKIELAMVPSPELNPVNVQDYRPEDLIDMLGLQLKVNDQLVKELDFTFGDEINAMFGNKTVEKEVTVSEQASEKNLVSYTYQITPISRLPQYIGAQVKIQLKDGLDRDGALLSVNQKDLLLEQRLHGGKFQVYVPRDKIASVKVLRLLKEDAGANQ